MGYSSTHTHAHIYIYIYYACTYINMIIFSNRHIATMYGQNKNKKLILLSWEEDCQ